MFEGIEKDILTGANRGYISIGIYDDGKGGRKFRLAATGRNIERYYTREFDWDEPDAKDDWGALLSIMTKLREWRQEVSDGTQAEDEA